MKVYGYARVSTRDQSLEIQIEQITKYCEYRNVELMHVYAENASGKDVNRPEFQRMLHDLETGAHMAEAVVIMKLDRLGRSLSDLIKISEWLNEHQIHLISTSDSIDTTTINGRLFFHISGAFAEYERGKILERVKLGQEAAREKGVKFGPKPKKIPLEKARRLLAAGVPKAAVARTLKISRNTLYKKLKEDEEAALAAGEGKGEE